jgi:hypothetical protein
MSVFTEGPFTEDELTVENLSYGKLQELIGIELDFRQFISQQAEQAGAVAIDKDVYWKEENEKWVREHVELEDKERVLDIAGMMADTDEKYPYSRLINRIKEKYGYKEYTLDDLKYDITLIPTTSRPSDDIKSRIPFHSISLHPQDPSFSPSKEQTTRKREKEKERDIAILIKLRTEEKAKRDSENAIKIDEELRDRERITEMNKKIETALDETDLDVLSSILRTFSSVDLDRYKKHLESEITYYTDELNKLEHPSEQDIKDVNRAEKYENDNKKAVEYYENLLSQIEGVGGFKTSNLLSYSDDELENFKKIEKIKNFNSEKLDLKALKFRMMELKAYTVYEEDRSNRIREYRSRIENCLQRMKRLREVIRKLPTIPNIPSPRPYGGKKKTKKRKNKKSKKSKKRNIRICK